jgi:hypothetical protein
MLKKINYHDIIKLLQKKFHIKLNYEESELLGRDQVPGSHHFRAFVGPPEKYDLVAANQFNILTSLGLREHHNLLDIGCGSLRGGRLFITYLLSDRYYGIEPEDWLLEEGKSKNIGNEMIKLKNPHFDNNKNFKLSVFGKTFDFILAQSIFTHASQNQIKQCITEAKNVMTSNSIFVTNFLKGDVNNMSNDWLYPGCGTYTLEFMLSLVNEIGLFGKPLKWNHPNGLIWIAITKEENKNNIPDI